MFHIELMLLIVCLYNRNCAVRASDELESISAVNISKDRTDVPCGEEKFPCGNTTICLDRGRHCDGRKDCANGEDEEGCADVHGSYVTLLKKIPHEELHDISNFSSFENCSLQNIPAPCECRFFTWLLCKGKNLTAVPCGVGGNITKMVLTNTSIKYLPKGAFSEYTGLNIIHIEENRIPRLIAGAFLGLDNVTILMLMKNQLEHVERGAFEGLENLQWLFLQGNNIVELDVHVFAELHSLDILHLTDNKLATLGDFPVLKQLSWLDVGNNRIRKIGKTTFHNLKALEVLTLKNNELQDIQEESFSWLFKLHDLDISYNHLTFLRPKLFWKLRSLNKLNLEFNMLNSLPHDIFTNLHSLKSLDLQGMEIHNIDIRLFRHVTNLEFIYFKKFLYCSYAPYVRICYPKTDGLSSTEHLLVWPALRMSVWVVALMTCMGNTLVLTWRVLSGKEDRVLSLFVKNLAVADLLMGVYLMAVGAQDVSFRDKYNKYAHAWMSSWHCTACGIIAMVSSEVSVFILSLITVERYRCIRTNFRVKYSSARYSLGLVWTAGIVLALFPVLLWSQEFGFYSSNGLCFPLHIDDPYLLGWQYSAFVFFGINFTAVILIIVLYLRMFLIIKHDRQTARPVVLKKHEDAVLALRFFFIVLTDCLCWIPIVIIKLLALVGIAISHNLYACVVVFILPINSALNPVLYTIAAPTELRRRIQKWLERALLCLHRLECLIISDPKTSVSSPLTQSLTNTESRSVSNGSILPHGAMNSSGARSELDRCLEQNEQERQDEISTTI